MTLVNEHRTISRLIDLTPSTGKHVSIHSVHEYCGCNPGFSVINVKHSPLLNDILHKSSKVKIQRRNIRCSGRTRDWTISPIHIFVKWLVKELRTMVSQRGDTPSYCKCGLTCGRSFLKYEVLLHVKVNKTDVSASSEKKKGPMTRPNSIKNKRKIAF